jgi:hypothetical protein
MTITMTMTICPNAIARIATIVAGMRKICPMGRASPLSRLASGYNRATSLPKSRGSGRNQTKMARQATMKSKPLAA